MLAKTSFIVLPNSLRQKTSELAHENHLGITPLKRYLRGKVFRSTIDDRGLFYT